MDEFLTNRAINTLRKIPVFSGLQTDEYQELLAVCKVSHANNGTEIFVENDPSLAMYVLLSGEVEMHTRESGCVYIMKPGDIFGEIGVISQSRRTATARASSDSALLELNKDKFDFLLGKRPLITAKVLRNVAKVLADRLVSSSSNRYLL